MELQEVVSPARRGLPDVHVQGFSLDDALEAYEALEKGEIHGWAVMVPD